MQIVKIPQIFKPVKCNTLVRVGKDNDGGYVIDSLSISRSDCLLSFGINDDWSFENQFVTQMSVPLYAFDASINKQFFQKKLYKSLRNFNLKHSVRNFKKLKAFNEFFNNIDRFHIESFVGFDYSKQNISFNSIKEVFLNDQYNQIFIKIDIEGSEYRILDDLISYQDKIAGLAIEFHDLDMNIDKVIRFIKNFKLQICHIHANNFAPINKDIPLSLELSFSSILPVEKSEFFYPTALDMPNNPKIDDYQIEFV